MRTGSFVCFFFFFWLFSQARLRSAGTPPAPRRSTRRTRHGRSRRPASAAARRTRGTAGSPAVFFFFFAWPRRGVGRAHRDASSSVFFFFFFFHANLRLRLGQPRAPLWPPASRLTAEFRFFFLPIFSPSHLRLRLRQPPARFACLHLRGGRAALGATRASVCVLRPRLNIHHYLFILSISWPGPTGLRECPRPTPAPEYSSFIHIIDLCC